MNKITNSKKIYAIIICYNSSPAIEQLYKKIDKNLFDKIYFFDDNSTDNSYEEAKKFDWHVIKNDQNLEYIKNNGKKNDDYEKELALKISQIHKVNNEKFGLSCYSPTCSWKENNHGYGDSDDFYGDDYDGDGNDD